MHMYSVNDLVGNLSAVKALQSGSCPTVQWKGRGSRSVEQLSHHSSKPIVWGCVLRCVYGFSMTWEEGVIAM